MVISADMMYTSGALHLLGFSNIAEATRWARDDFARPLIVLGLTE